MTLGRGWLVTQIGARLATPLSDAGIPVDDDSQHLKEPIDDTLRALGFAEADLAAPVIEDTEAAGLIALGVWFTIKHARSRVSNRFSLTSRGSNLQLRQTFENLGKLLEDAQAEVIRIYGDFPAGAVSDDDPFVYVDLNQKGSYGLPVDSDWPWTFVGAGDG